MAIWSVQRSASETTLSTNYRSALPSHLVKFPSAVEDHLGAILHQFCSSSGTTMPMSKLPLVFEKSFNLPMPKAFVQWTALTTVWTSSGCFGLYSGIRLFSCASLHRRLGWLRSGRWVCRGLSLARLEVTATVGPCVRSAQYRWICL